MEFGYQLEGYEKMFSKLAPKELLGPALKTAFQKSTLTIQRNAQKHVKVDTGRLKSSITSEVDKSDIPQWGRVYTSVTYAPFVEFDTRPHFPPLAALEGWAHRHGTSAFMVARAIARRGTKGVHMFERGLDESQNDVDRFLKEAAKDIEGGFNR